MRHQSGDGVAAAHPFIHRSEPKLPINRLNAVNGHKRPVGPTPQVFQAISLIVYVCCWPLFHGQCVDRTDKRRNASSLSLSFSPLLILPDLSHCLPVCVQVSVFPFVGRRRHPIASSEISLSLSLSILLCVLCYRRTCVCCSRVTTERYSK